MKFGWIASLLALMFLGSAAHAVGPNMVNDHGLYQLKTVEAAQELRAAIALVNHNLILAQVDRKLLKVCHAIGMLNATTATLSAWGMNGPSTEARKAAVTEVVQLMSEVNTFCQVAVNIRDVKPRERLTDIRQLPNRLREMEFHAERIEKGVAR